jgi:Ca-activated chloride channel family protein
MIGLAPAVLAQAAGRAEPIEIVPQARPWRGVHQARLSAADVRVAIDNQIATTTIELALTNDASVPQEAQVLLPVPEGVTIRFLQFDGVGSEPTAKLLPRNEARRIYDAIVHRRRDPALLEFAGYGVIRTSAFPIPGRTTLKVRITYEQVVVSDQGRVEYLFPRSDALAAGEASGVTWTFSCSIRSDRPIATVYSSSHQIATRRPGPDQAEVTIGAAQAAAPGAFRLCYLPQAGEGSRPSATLMAYPDPAVGDGGGYFLLLAALPPKVGEASAQRREVTLVIDRSGSMNGEKIQQAREAALAVVSGLRDGESFNIIDFSDSIQSFERSAVVKSAETFQKARAYIGGIASSGGTNIHDALLEAVRPGVTEGTLPMTLFLTDGLATVGVTGEYDIREAVRQANTHERRLFTFGVGYDVNTPLLSSLASSARGASTFVQPGENIESKVGQVFRRLDGPRLAGPKLESESGVREVQPPTLGDVFEGDQIVVVGQYTSTQPLRFRLTGSDTSGAVAHEMVFDAAAAASARNGSIPRLWATRKIGFLLAQVREHTAKGVRPYDPRVKELSDEIVRLSIRYGVMTEYTSFLATEPGVSIATAEERRSFLNGSLTRLEDRLSARSGREGMNQEMNYETYQDATQAPAVQRYLNAEMKEETVIGVQAVAQNAIYWRWVNATPGEPVPAEARQRWVDARLLERERDNPDLTVTFGAKDYDDVAQKLIDRGEASYLAMPGEVLVLIGTQRVLLRNTD